MRLAEFRTKHVENLMQALDSSRRIEGSVPEVRVAMSAFDEATTAVLELLRRVR